MRVGALATMALIGLAGSFALANPRDPAPEGPSTSAGQDGGSSLAGGDGSGEGLPQDTLELGGGGPDDGSQASDTPRSSGSGTSNPSASAAGGGPSSSSSASASSSSSSSSTSSSSSSSTSSSSTGTGGPGAGLGPELGDGLGTGGLVNGDQFVQDVEDGASSATSTASSVAGGLPLP